MKNKNPIVEAITKYVKVGAVFLIASIYKISQKVQRLLYYKIIFGIKRKSFISIRILIN